MADDKERVVKRLKSWKETFEHPEDFMTKEQVENEEWEVGEKELDFLLFQIHQINESDEITGR